MVKAEVIHSWVVAGRCVTELQRMCCELWMTLLRKIQRGQKILHVVQRFFETHKPHKAEASNWNSTPNPSPPTSLIWPTLLEVAVTSCTHQTRPVLSVHGRPASLLYTLGFGPWLRVPSPQVKSPLKMFFKDKERSQASPVPLGKDSQPWLLFRISWEL